MSSPNPTLPPPRRPPRRWLLRAGAIAGVALFLGLMVRFWHPVYGFTSLLQLDPPFAEREIAAFREYPVFVYDVPGPYDGLQYAQIAYHPLLDAPELKTAVDLIDYRSRRILLPATAWLLAAGRPAWIANVYASLNIVCWLVLAALLWRVLPVDGPRPLLVWAATLFSAGPIGSVRCALTDLPAATLVVAAVWAAERARPRAAVAWLAAVGLTREAALVAWPGLWNGPWKSPGAIARNLLRGALAAAPLALWLVYVRSRVGMEVQGWESFAKPGTGWFAAVRGYVDQVVAGRDLPFSWVSLLAVLSLTAQCVFIALRRQPGDRWWRVGAAHVVLLLMLGPVFWDGFPVGALRVLLPLSLACNILIARTRAPMPWLLACNLSIISAFIAVQQIPHNRVEIGATRHGAIAGVVRVGAGWYGREENWRNCWAWTSQGGSLAVVTWPRSQPVTTQLRFSLRALTPRTVAIRAAGREIWRGPVGVRLTPVSLPPMTTSQGRVELEFVSTDPPVREGVGPHPRLLGFALYDPVLSVSVSEAADP